MIPAFLLAAAGAAQAPLHRSDYRCAGGAMIFFERGSAQINTEGANRLASFVAGSRAEGIIGMVNIESGGDGYGSRFNASLSRRRSEAIRTLLAYLRHRARSTNVVVGEDLRRSSETEDDYQTLMGWVAQLLPREEYDRRFPAGLIVECF
jgi:hypothetical protein